MLLPLGKNNNRRSILSTGTVCVYNFNFVNFSCNSIIITRDCDAKNKLRKQSKPGSIESKINLITFLSLGTERIFSSYN